MALARGHSLASMADMVDAAEACEDRACAPMDAILELVGGDGGQSEPPERFRRRGALLARHMRLAKSRHRFQRLATTGVQKHLGKLTIKIKRIANKYCVRRSEAIDFSPSSPGVRGRGGYKRWLPRAVQRVCFGRGWAPPSQAARRLTKKTPQARSVYATSVTGTADAFEGSAGHVERLRKAIAE
eukprot:2864459-Alexandrium_andersonii.AAC.1